MATESTRILLDQLGWESVEAIIETADSMIRDAVDLVRGTEQICVHDTREEADECEIGHVRRGWELRKDLEMQLHRAEAMAQVATARLKLAELIRNAGGTFTYGMND